MSSFMQVQVESELQLFKFVRSLNLMHLQSFLMKRKESYVFKQVQKVVYFIMAISVFLVYILRKPVSIKSTFSKSSKTMPIFAGLECQLTYPSYTAYIYLISGQDIVKLDNLSHQQISFLAGQKIFRLDNLSEQYISLLAGQKISAGQITHQSNRYLYPCWLVDLKVR